MGLQAGHLGQMRLQPNPNFVDPSVNIPSNSFAQSVVGSYQQDQPCYQSD